MSVNWELVSKVRALTKAGMKMYHFITNCERAPMCCGYAVENNVSYRWVRSNDLIYYYHLNRNRKAIARRIPGDELYVANVAKNYRLRPYEMRLEDYVELLCRHNNMGLDISKLNPLLQDDCESECKSNCCVENKGCSCDTKGVKHHDEHDLKIKPE